MGCWILRPEVGNIGLFRRRANNKLSPQDELRLESLVDEAAFDPHDAAKRWQAITALREGFSDDRVVQEFMALLDDPQHAADPVVRQNVRFALQGLAGFGSTTAARALHELRREAQ